MSDLLEFLKVVFESPLKSLLIIFLFLAAIRGTYEGVKWLKGELNTWYQKKQTADKKDETLEDRISTLERDNAQQFDTLEHISAVVQNISATLETLAEDEKANTVAICRSQLWNLYGKFKDRETLTSEEYETFSDLSDRYLNNGGNSVFRDKVIPFIKSKPVED